MGYGDEIIATGHARAEHTAIGGGKKIAIVGLRGEKRWSELWRDNPIILQPMEHGVPYHPIQNGPGCRPYIKPPFTRATGWHWSGWKVDDHPGELYLTHDEDEFGRRLVEAGRFVMIEPYCDPHCTLNKAWPWSNFAQVVELCRGAGIRFVQPVYGPGRQLPHVEPVETGSASAQSIRNGCAVLRHASLYVGIDSAFQHAARALGTPAVVVFGGCTNAEVLGYSAHTNIVAATPGTPCGKIEPCDHCQAAMESITPDQVAAAILERMGQTVTVVDDDDGGDDG